MTALSKMTCGFLLALATSVAANAQDVSTIAKVSVGTAAITAGVVLLHGHSSVSAASSTGEATSFTGSDIGRGGNTSGATFAGYGNNTSNGGSAANAGGPLAPGGAAGIQAASGDTSDAGVFTLFVPAGLPSPIITILTCATSTLATGSTSTGSTASTGTSP